MVAPGLRRYLATLLQYKLFIAAYAIVSLWIIFELRMIGLWMVGSITQTLLALLTIHLWMTLLDMSTLSVPAQKQSCESCTQWFQVEHFLSLAQLVVLFLVAPHWPLTLIVAIGVAWDSYDFFVRSVEGRVLDSTTIWKSQSAYGKLCLVKMVAHAFLFVLFLAYVGPWTILVSDSHYPTEQ